ncbi:hypothetical protein JTB14_011586 [Gonioctena quinquepunctata]|nr:hypothetical protein JTB14_011586 [Gonioctena quinquepunctata]
MILLNIEETGDLEEHQESSTAKRTKFLNLKAPLNVVQNGTIVNPFEETGMELVTLDTDEVRDPVVASCLKEAMETGETMSWLKSASPSNGISGYKACGICPFNPNIIPDKYFAISDLAAQQPTSLSTSSVSTDQRLIIPADDSTLPLTPSCSSDLFTPKPTTSLTDNVHVSPPTVPHVDQPTLNESIDATPSKILEELSPVPIVIDEKKKERNKTLKNESTNRKLPSREKVVKVKKRIIRSLLESSDDPEECCECTEQCFATSSKVDWIRCIECKKCLHEDCTLHGDVCNICGRQRKMESIKSNMFKP